MMGPLPAELLEAASRAVEARLGLRFPPERWSDLERGLRGAAEELGFGTVEACVQALVSSELGREQVAALAGHLTVGETYFFRDPAAFGALEKRILPALIEQRRGRSKRLRIWSAGCCTGEEPYSIAITLRRAFPELHDWQVTILATDVNPRFLHKAMAGVYRRWSFRGVSEATRAAWFRPKGDDRWEVLPAVREAVTFACLNLVEDPFPSLTTHTNAMDLIFCRNVLMYFAPEQLHKVVAKFRRTLVEGGHLLVSPTEGSREWFEGFEAVEEPGIALYRKGAVEVKAAPDRSHETYRTYATDEVNAPPAEQVAEARTAAEEADEAQRLANAGQLSEALAACDRALAADKLVGAHHYLRGMILQEQGRLEEAVEALRRALYLEPDCAIAHFALGHLRSQQGQASEAARSFENARRLLKALPADAVLPASDGMTAGRLLEMVAETEEALA
jgi:chemotaxis protein methyltransferase CheR